MSQAPLTSQVLLVDQEPASSTRIDALLAELWNQGGTDLLLADGLPPQLRVHGELTSLPHQPSMTADDTRAILGEVISAETIATVMGGTEHDFSFSWRDQARIRGNAFRQSGVISIAFRMIPRTVPTMAELGLPPTLGTFTRIQQGLVLVTGPTGSGKSTTLAAMIGEINAQRACHIITIEDPIEYVHDHKRAMVTQREVGSDTASFHHALRSALREDPDVLLVGEMRDLESIRFALTIAETGHLVFATLHTNDTAQSIGRIIDVFPAEQQAQIRVQLSSALTGVVYQRLLPALDGGMVAAYEVMVADPAVRNLIKEGKTNQLRNSLVTGQRAGMVTFEQSLTVLIREGRISAEDAISRSLYPKEIELPPAGPTRLSA